MNFDLIKFDGRLNDALDSCCGIDMGIKSS